MLQHLNIQNFALITALEVEFQMGMTVLTGETGAGKSILIDALLLALGDRADMHFIQTDCDRCNISATFSIEKLPLVQQWLQQHELNTDYTCLLRRVISKDGRSRSFINGQSVPLHQLRELGNLLISIHGQHEHQTLLKCDKQRALLDVYAKHIPLLQQVENLYLRLEATRKALTQLQTQSEQRQSRQELLQYQLAELCQLNLHEEELEQLDREQKQLANAEQLLRNAQNVLTLLDEGEEHNLLNLLSVAQTQLQNLQALDSRLTNISELLNNAIIQTQEVSNELQRYTNAIELDPERLQQVEERLSAIHDLARKHRTSPAGLLLLQKKLTDEFSQLENSDAQIKNLQKEIAQLTEDYYEAAKKLSESRRQAASRLAPLIIANMARLNMPGGRFEIQLTPYSTEQISNNGLERVEFYVSANPGQPLQSLAKVASGGELSRISLAIHVLTAQSDATPTLIFDEVDVGIGGSTAEIVGQLLRTLSNTTQVLCVTHLPQVAAQGHHHFQIDKITRSNVTKTKIRLLDKSARIQEIARMLGGVKITEQTLAHAEEMVTATT